MKWIYRFIFLAGLLWSGYQPFDRFTWFMEVFPAILGGTLLYFTRHSFPWCRLTYFMILVHVYVLYIGGHYTYARVPAFDWLRDIVHGTRNQYDKVGHFMQGFVPSFLIREFLIRKNILGTGRPLFFFTLFACISISVGYEFLEWGTAMATGSGADDFLGTQGYIWDTQSDMLFATLGSLSMLLFFQHQHQRSMAAL